MRNFTAFYVVAGCEIPNVLVLFHNNIIDPKGTIASGRPGQESECQAHIAAA